MNPKIKNKKRHEIDPDEIFMDSHNLPNFDVQQFEGRLDKPISKLSLMIVIIFFILCVSLYSAKVWALQVRDGEKYNSQSENNRLRHSPIFATRGIIYDRNGVELVWNEPGDDDADVFLRKYKSMPGLAHVLGYVQYPSKDSAGFYYREDFEGVDGAEKYFNQKLRGKNGINLIEVDAHGKIQSQNVIEPPNEGESINLSIDSRIQSEIYMALKDIAEKVGFSGGAGIMMDLRSGEVIAMASYPEFDPEVMSSKKDSEKVRSFLNDQNKPFLNRAVDGLYAPGSIIKPYVALAALNEKVIDPQKQILSTGSISVQNQYYPDLKTIFKDWKAHGWVDMRHAIAVSSDVYFYEIGGGYKDQKGLGIARIERYFKEFGFGQSIQDNATSTLSTNFFNGADGTIPSPEWKKEHFNGESWNLGNTYHTSIGQYGFQVSPMQIVRALASVVNNGLLRNPTIIKDEMGRVVKNINIPSEYFSVIKEGMRLGAQTGTGTSLNVSYIDVATKSGTAELGSTKDKVNSWMTGYFPYKNPHYAFAMVMEKGSVHNLIGSGAAMREVLDWMNVNTPEYFK